jgi:hypothetical protein
MIYLLITYINIYFILLLIIMKTDREKYIDNYVDSIISQDKWDDKRKKHIDYLSKKYYKELDNYIYVEDINEFNDIKLGGYIRFINNNDEIRWGGILAKKYNQENNHYMIIINNDKIIKICFEKNFIFYKKNRTASDKMRDIFISSMDKYTDDNYN